MTEKKRGNLFANVAPSDDEITEVLAQKNTVRIERIISYGQTSPPGFWYDQKEIEYVAVLEGRAELEFSDEIMTLNAGDWVIIPAHEKHRVAYTSKPCVWLAVFVE